MNGNGGKVCESTNLNCDKSYHSGHDQARDNVRYAAVAILTKKRFQMPETDRHVNFEIFKSSFKSWEALFEEAATFADSVGPQHLIGISH